MPRVRDALAEGATLPVLGAIANAVTDAIGARIRDLAITPDKVLNAIKNNNPA
jgi:CO/xanthine dehydrogenase Mo-binding subunit